MQAPRALRHLVLRDLAKRNHSSHPVSTLNDLPTPQGNWKTHYDAKQRGYNLQLLGGIAVLTGTILFGKATGFLDLHNDIPERPADIASYR